jgi:hypothetical protein
MSFIPRRKVADADYLLCRATAESKAAKMAVDHSSKQAFIG